MKFSRASATVGAASNAEKREASDGWVAGGRACGSSAVRVKTSSGVLCLRGGVCFLVGSLLVLVGLCADGALAHQYGMGACPPSVPFKDNFDIEKFLGEWFVIQKSSSLMSCLKVNITRGTGENLKISEYRRMGLLQKALDHTMIDVGTLKIPDPTEPAKMTVKFSLSAWTEPFTIVDTDYTNYAATFSCVAAAGMGYRRNGMILSRKPVLDNTTSDKLRKTFEFFGVDSSSFSFIDQKPCTGMLKSKSDHDRVISLGPLNINRNAES